MGGAEAGRGSGGARGTGAASLRQEVAGRGTRGQVGAEGEGEAGGGPASYRARPAAAGLVVAAAAAWLCGRWVFGLMVMGRRLVLFSGVWEPGQTNDC